MGSKTLTMSVAMLANKVYKHWSTDWARLHVSDTDVTAVNNPTEWRSAKLLAIKINYDVIFVSDNIIC